MIRHISLFLFLFIIKLTEATYLSYPECLETEIGCEPQNNGEVTETYLPFPECLEDERGCDPCEGREYECQKEEDDAAAKLEKIILIVMPPFLIIGLVIVRAYAISWYDIMSCRKTDQFLDVEKQQNQQITNEWVESRRNLHGHPAVVCCFLSLLGVAVLPIPLPCIIHGVANREKEEHEIKLQEIVNKQPTGTWKEYRNKNLMERVLRSKGHKGATGGGNVMLVHDWRNKTTAIDNGTAKTLEHRNVSKEPMEDLKRIVEQNGYSAITIYDDYNHAVLRKFNTQLNATDCEDSRGYKCTTFIFTPAPPPPPPPPYDPNNPPQEYKQHYPDEAVFGSGWKLVRHKKDDGLPFQSKDNLMGTECYGNADGNPHSFNNWSIRYNHMKYDQILFTTWDYQIWAIVTRASLETSIRYGSGRSQIDYVKTYMRNDYHRKYGLWYNGRAWQPWVAANEFYSSWGTYNDSSHKPMVLYCQKQGSSGWGGWGWGSRYRDKTSYAWPVGGGINIFVRDSSTSFTPPNWNWN